MTIKSLNCASDLRSMCEGIVKKSKIKIWASDLFEYYQFLPKRLSISVFYDVLAGLNKETLATLSD